jgi:hypothetical protein
MHANLAFTQALGLVCMQDWHAHLYGQDLIIFKARIFYKVHMRLEEKIDETIREEGMGCAKTKSRIGCKK